MGCGSSKAAMVVVDSKKAPETPRRRENGRQTTHGQETQHIVATSPEALPSSTGKTG